jgi:hypothetical protein
VNQDDGRETFIVLSISLVRSSEYLLELVPKKRLEPKERKERWRVRDESYTDDLEGGSPYMYARMAPPILIPVSAKEFGELDPHVGMEVWLRITPVGV